MVLSYVKLAFTYCFYKLSYLKANLHLCHILLPYSRINLSDIQDEMLIHYTIACTLLHGNGTLYNVHHDIEHANCYFVFFSISLWPIYESFYAVRTKLRRP